LADWKIGGLADYELRSVRKDVIFRNLPFFQSANPPIKFLFLYPSVSIL
jgi:hypothetical protein